jgi:hypothetical protein
MTNEAKIRVRLDTGPAKAALAELASHAGGVAGSIGGGVGRGALGAVRSALSHMGAGAAFGAGIAAINGPTGDTFQSLIGESLGAYGAQMSSQIFGDLGPEAAAGAAAREDLIGAYGAVRGREGQWPAGAEQYYANRKQFHMEAALGKQAAETDPRFRGADVEGIANQLGDAIQRAAQAGWDRIMSQISGGSRG